MDISPHVDAVRADLVTLADAANPDGREFVERLARALEPSLRMAVLGALTDAAAEITNQVPSGSVEVRLRGREPEFIVDVPPPPAAPLEGPNPDPGLPDEDEEPGNVVRITLRLPEAIKASADELASRSGRSLNAWIVGALRAATRDDGWSLTLNRASVPGSRRAQRPTSSEHHITGWI